MSKHLYISVTILFMSITSVFANPEIWYKVDNFNIKEQLLKPTSFTLYQVDDIELKKQLFSLSENPEEKKVIMLPSPSGNMIAYNIWQTPIMHPQLAAKFPNIKNFTATAVDNSTITAKINYTHHGFNAMIYNGNKTYLIDPYSSTNNGYYHCYYKKDFPDNPQHRFHCMVSDNKELGTTEAMFIGNKPPKTVFKTHGGTKRTYRLALSCSGEYAVAVAGSNPTKSAVVSAMATSISRVNGILEREIAVSLQLIANNDLIVYLDPATDPFTTIQNNVISGSTQSANQSNIDNIFLPTDYDIGHVFCSGNGGIADLASLCDNNFKARGATGSPNPVGDPFDVDYVVHEIGHQLGADHTFNYSGSGCTTSEEFSAYEPGSGTTIMAYAGLCPGNNIQNNSDDYFHTRSLDQMTSYITSTGPLCGTTSATNNTPPAVADIATVYNIPHKTPFELEAPLAADGDNDILNYCWEQYDLGDYGKSLAIAQLGPIFRSFKPTISRWRIFPTLDSLRRGTKSYPGEKLPEVTRNMNFKLTVRDMLNGIGSYNVSDNELTLSVTDQSGPFELTSQNSNSDYWRKGNSYTVTWNVANTTQPPVSCSSVDIYLSYDDGATWPVVLASSTPNDGSEVITVPAGQNTWGARVKVKGSGNVFFDMSDDAFRINEWPDSITDVDAKNGIKVYPIPARSMLNIQLVDGGFYSVRISNSIGQTVWTGTIEQNSTIDVNSFAGGVYHISFSDKTNGKFAVKKVIIE